MTTNRYLIIPRHKAWAAAFFVQQGGNTVVTPDGRFWKEILTDDDYDEMRQKLYPQPPTGEYVDD